MNNPFFVNNAFMNPMINMGAPAFPPIMSLGKLSGAAGQSGASTQSILDYLAQPFQTVGLQQQEAAGLGKRFE